MDEFVDGCAKLQGEATALETKVLHMEVGLGAEKLTRCNAKRRVVKFLGHFLGNVKI